MPTYSYACTACDHRFDAVQAFTDPSLTECPQCQGRLRKLFSAVGIVFKGSGFYRTDSRSAPGETSNGKRTSGESAKSDGASSNGSSGASGSSGSSGGSSSGGSSSGGSATGSSGAGSTGSTAKAAS